MMISAVIIFVVCFSTISLQSPVGECPKEDGPHPTYLPDSDNCAIFYECNGGYPFLIYCPPDTAFDSRVNVCVYSPGGQCLETYDSEESSEVASDKINNYFKLSALKSLGREGHLAKKCPPEDDVYPTFLIDPTNCSRYYECSHGKPFLINCPPGEEFNAEQLVCDLPENAGCKVKAQSRVLSEGNLDDKCPEEDGEYPTFLVDPTNCSRYYECAHGHAFLINCPPGEEFNAQKLVCDLPENAGCSIKHLLVDAIQDNSGPDLATSCPEVDGVYPTFLIDPENCSRYYECAHGKPFIVDCPPGLEFNSQLLVCDLPENAGCSPAS